MAMIGPDHNMMETSRPVRDLDQTGERSFPLLLPEVKDGRPTTSRAWLFRLPQEILDIIMGLVTCDKSALAALALVDKDCRKLARCYQFFHVHLRYGQPSVQFVQALLQEAATRANPDSSRNGPLISSYIRRVTFKRALCFCGSRHNTPNYQLSDESESEEGRQISSCQDEADAHVTDLVKPFLAAIAGIPRLESISWLDPVRLDTNFLNAVTPPSVRLLQLTAATLDGPDVPELPETLRILTLDIGLYLQVRDGHEDPSPLSRFAASLVKRCQQSVVALRLSTGLRLAVDYDCPVPLHERIVLSLSSEHISLRRLRVLDLQFAQIDSEAMAVLVRSSLRHLCLPSNWGDMSEFLESCKVLPKLQTLVIPKQHESASALSPIQPVLRFLDRHSHIRKLVIGLNSKTFLAQLLPSLTNNNWRTLTSLSLHCNSRGTNELARYLEPFVPKSVLAAVATITTLEQLRLSAGDKVDPTELPTWRVDHDTIRQGLKPLTRLVRLALVADTYVISGTRPMTAYALPYYDFKIIKKTERNDAKRLKWLDDPLVEVIDNLYTKERALIWERAHRYKMIQEALKYVAVFPTLEWIYCGQWPMRFVPVSTLPPDAEVPEGSLSPPKYPLPCTDGRMNPYYWPYLEGIFGLPI